MCSQETSSSYSNVNKESSCILQCNKKLQVLVPPLYCMDLMKGIFIALNKLTEGYCQELGGLVLGYKNVKVDSNSGWIHSTNPYIHIHVVADFDVFIPTKGCCIEGVVNEVSNNKVSFLAYNKFNVVYRIQDVRYKLTCATQQKNPSATANAATCRVALDHLEQITPGLKEGDTCTLLLHEVAFKDYLPHLRGYPVPKGLDTSSLLSDATEQATPICAPPATDGAAGRKVRFSDQESDNSDLADISVRDIQLLTPPTSHGGRTSDSDDDSGPTVPTDSSSSGKKPGSRDIKQEKLSPARGLDLPDIGRGPGNDSDESSEEEALLPPPPPPQINKKKKKKKRQPNAGSVGGPVNVKTLQEMIESCMLPEPMADDSRDFTSGDMVAVKQEILEVAEGRSTKKKKKNRNREDKPVTAMDVVMDEKLADSVTTKKKKKKKIKSGSPADDKNAVSAAAVEEFCERTSKKRKSCADAEQADSGEILKPSKKKRKLNT